MFLIYLPAALLFRSASVAQTGLLLQRLFSTGFSLNETLSILQLNGFGILQLALVLTAMTRLHVWGAEDLPSAPDGTGNMRRIVSAAYFVLIILLSSFALLAAQETTGFAYFQF